MYYIAVKNRKGQFYIDAEAEDWHEIVDNFEPIDCTMDELIIYNEKGHKFLVGPEKKLKSKKLAFGMSWTQVGDWDFDKGEPFLIDTGKIEPKELKKLKERSYKS